MVDLEELVRICLHDHDAWRARRDAAREQARSEGARLVVFEQEEKNLAVYDAATGEQLYLGPRGPLPADADHWANIDNVDLGVPLMDTPVIGIPEGLVSAVREWVESFTDDARAWVAPEGEE